MLLKLYEKDKIVRRHIGFSHELNDLDSVESDRENLRNI